MFNLFKLKDSTPKVELIVSNDQTSLEEAPIENAIQDDILIEDIKREFNITGLEQTLGSKVTGLDVFYFIKTQFSDII